MKEFIFDFMQQFSKCKYHIRKEKTHQMSKVSFEKVDKQRHIRVIEQFSIASLIICQNSYCSSYYKIKQKNMSIEKNTTLESINYSPLNASKSKQMFTFTKAYRFSDIKDSTSSFYDKPSTLDQRTTSFGFGNKSQLVNKYQNNPSPDKYTKQSEFQVSPKKGVSLGLGRNDCKNISIFNKENNPAPTDYSLQSSDQKNQFVYTMRQKLKLPQLFPEKKTPGPGQYFLDENETNNKNGISLISKYKSNICFKISNDSPKSIQKLKYPGIGPTTYNTVMGATGKQILSKKTSEKSFYFDKHPRITTHTDCMTPGPGAYKFFSQFDR